ncbi:unnamed protein product, partial [Iphiclides podalirius]
MGGESTVARRSAYVYNVNQCSVKTRYRSLNMDFGHPPPNMGMPPPGMGGLMGPPGRNNIRHNFRPFNYQMRFPPQGPLNMTQDDFDDKEVGCIEGAHESIVWTMAWHPLGHILCSGSNDHTSKFWTRNRPGDQMRDKYNLNTLPPGVQDDHDLEEPAIIPGMGPEDKVEIFSSDTDKVIPGLDLDTTFIPMEFEKKAKKVPYSKPIPRNFQAQWNHGPTVDDAATEALTQALVESVPGAVPLQQLTPSAIFIYGKLITVDAGSKLEKAILDGPIALKKYIATGEIEELHDMMPHLENDDNFQPFEYPTQESESDAADDENKEKENFEDEEYFENSQDTNKQTTEEQDFDNFDNGSEMNNIVPLNNMPQMGLMRPPVPMNMGPMRPPMGPPLSHMGPMNIPPPLLPGMPPMGTMPPMPNMPPMSNMPPPIGSMPPHPPYPDNGYPKSPFDTGYENQSFSQNNEDYNEGEPFEQSYEEDGYNDDDDMNDSFNRNQRWGGNYRGRGHDRGEIMVDPVVHPGPEEVAAFIEHLEEEINQFQTSTW